MRGLLVGMMLGVIAVFAANAYAQRTITAEEADRFYASLVRQSGAVVNIAGEVAKADVSYDFDFIDAFDADRLLVDMLGNPPGPPAASQGVVMPAGQNPLYGGWFAELTYDPVGYVSDANVQLDADDLLQQMRAIEDARNQQRSPDGQLSIAGWAYSPGYDPATRTIDWAISATSAYGSTLNYQMYVLGRYGVVGIKIITPDQDVNTAIRNAAAVRRMISFNPGYRHEERQPGDYVAILTPGELVTGQPGAFPADTAPAPAAPYPSEPYGLTYEFAPQAPAAAPPPPEWMAAALWGVLAGHVLLFALLVVLSSRGNEAVSREKRDRLTGVRKVEIDRLVRARESLRVVRSYFGQTTASVGALYYVLIVAAGAGFILYANMGRPATAYPDETPVAVEQTYAAPATEAYPVPADPYAAQPAEAYPEAPPTAAAGWFQAIVDTGPAGQIAIGFIAINIVAVIVLAFLSIFQFIHRRFTAFFQVAVIPIGILVNVASIGVGGPPMFSALESAFGRESPWPNTIMLIILFGLIIASTIMIFGWGRNCWRVMMARRDNFLVARGWRAPGWSLGNAVRRMLGVPTYVSALKSGRRRVMLMFMMAGALGAGAALFPLAAPGLVGALLPGFAVGVDPNTNAGDPVGFVLMYFGAMAVILLVIFLLLHLLALFGRMITRAARRMSANRYQSVREWDHRAPVLYLRSFTIDNQPVKVRPRGWTARLIGLGGVFPTLDEAVLDCAAPYGPVIAIGDPRDPIPPLGAARKFVGGGDWQQVVADLANASQLIVMAVDSTEGVRWEVRHIVERGHAAKTLFLASPSRSPAERAASLTEVAQLLGHPDLLPKDAIGVSPSKGGGIEVLKSPTTSGDAYAVVLNLRLQQDFGLKVKFPKRGGDRYAMAAGAR